MPINLTAQGGADFRANVQSLDAAQARQSLEKIQAHLSQPGKGTGTLTLFNRTNAEGELTLERKSGFQLLGRGARLKDTSDVLKTLLDRAGFPEAKAELEQHLNTSNRVGAAKLLEILDRQVGVEAGKQEAAAFVRGNRQNADPLGQLKSRLELCQNQLENARRANANPDYQFKVNSAHREQTRILSPQQEIARLQASIRVLTKEIKTLRAPRKLPGVSAPSFKDLLKNAGVRWNKETVASGANGGVHNATRNKEPLMLKTYHNPDAPVILSNSRGVVGNEAIAAYLTSKSNHKGYKVNVAQPRYFLVKPRGGEEHRMVKPLELRTLLKATPEVSWECVGLLMPKAKGGEVGKLLQKGQLTGQDQRKIIQGTLKAVLQLNARGFIHRDLKPANMFFDAASGQTTLIDTGLMHKTSKNKPETRYLPGAAGSPAYVHPRAFNGVPLGTETDLYATAVMALELAHGETGNALVDRMMALAQHGHLDPEQNFADAMMTKRPSGRIGPDLAFSQIRRAMADPNSLTSLAVACLKQAGRPAEEWADQATAQGIYAELLRHPSLQES